MTEILSTSLNENGSGVITVALTDSEGTPITPVTATWSLYTAKYDGRSLVRGDLVGTLEDQAVVGTLSSTLYIVLSGADLAIVGDTSEEYRALTITGTYNTTINGVEFLNHPFTLEAIIKVGNLLGES